ncbi:MAG: DUF1015 domain-containing protein [Acidobacteria bacterium]|nr:DUF1015 domain-containing protein [Acidobacteriota bacterium]
MASLIPFRALRPTPESAAQVAAVPYDVVNTDEARALAAGNPLSFLHVSRAEIDLPPGTDIYSDAVYAKAAANFAALTAAAPLVVEAAPSVYVYRLRMGAHVQTGVAGCYSVAEYESDVIRKHERTRRDKEDDRTRHILELRAQTGPVFLTYRASGAVDGAVQQTTAERPLFDVTAADGVQHTIWRVAPPGQRALVAAFQAIESLYIADGHHRAASAARVARQLGGSGGSGDWDSFLAVAFPDDQVQVLPYNRSVKDLGSHTPQTLLAEIRRHFTVKDGPAAPARKGEVAMRLGGRWHTIEIPVAREGLAPADRLDVTRLQDLILTPLLGILDVRADTRIDFVGGIRGTLELERIVESGRAAVAFSMYPVSVDELMLISDAGGIMPPKSTWFEPKLRDGLLSHVI